MNKTQEKFIFFGHGRSGSHLLGDFINQHPNAYFDDELFNPGRLAKLSFLKRWVAITFPHIYFYARLKDVRSLVYGFSFIYYQFNSANTTLEEMYSRGWKIIYLNRSNVLDQLLSHEVAMLKKKWHRKDSDDRDVLDQQFTMDVEQCVEKFKHILAQRKKELSLLEGKNYLSINYERDLLHEEQHQKTMDMVFTEFGLKTIRLQKPAYKKVFSKPYSEIVTNYSELNTVIKNEGLPIMLGAV